MIAPKQLAPPFEEWNRRWNAPHGRRWPYLRALRHQSMAVRYKGPFAAQPNSQTRRFEYPWAHSEIAAIGRQGLRIVEIGGGLSGLQFVLAHEGHHVTNIDPGQPELGWGEKYQRRHTALTRAFHAPVDLRPTTLAKAGIGTQEADVVLCVSVLEHLPDSALAEFAEHVPRILRPDGRLILTVDLFLNVEPFCRQVQNQWGRNIDVYRVLQDARLELVKGDPEVLNGFPPFAPERVLERLDTFLLPANYPCLAQCIVARRAS